MRPSLVAAVALLGLVTGCDGGGDRPKGGAKATRAKSGEPVPYVVTGSRTSNDVNLWSDAERSEPKAKHKVPSGTKVKILEKREMPGSRGATMCRVRAATGEEGWIPEKFVEYRDE